SGRRWRLATRGQPPRAAGPERRGRRAGAALCGRAAGARGPGPRSWPRSERARAPGAPPGRGAAGGKLCPPTPGSSPAARTGAVPGVAGDLLAPSRHDDLRVRAQHLDRAADPVEGHAVAPALEADEAVEAPAPAHDHVEGRLHVPERLQVKPLDPEGFLDRGA